jgi:hypothetical protein
MRLVRSATPVKCCMDEKKRTKTSGLYLTLPKKRRRIRMHLKNIITMMI